MKQSSSLYLFICFLCISEFNYVNAQPTPFQKLYFIDPFKPGSSKYVNTNFFEIEALSDGGFATIGFVTDTNNISQGILSRYDCLGNVMWTKLLGRSATPTNIVMGIAETDLSDLVFTFPLSTGFFQASTLIGRLDRNGKVKWMKRIGNNTEFGRDIVRTPDAGFVIAGSTGFHGTDRTADDIYLVKIDSTGNVLWTKTFGNPGGTYDEAFSIKTDSKGNLIVTGRCIALGTFQAFILKADSNGNPINFKTYGFDNQRTYAFDVLVDRQDNYLITGSTTVYELDHLSNEYDVFLIKVDSALNTIFTNVYEPNIGADAGAIGEGLALGPDGRYIIGVSTYAFSLHNASGPNSPSKNALYSVNPDGSLYKAYIYNMKGSQYTRVRTTMDGFYISGFSNAYAGNVSFQGLIIKTDNNYLSGCNDIEVTSELNTYTDSSVWDIQNFQYQISSGIRSINYSNDVDTNIQTSVICETQIELHPMIDGPAMVCVDEEFTIIDSSNGNENAKHIWLLNGQPIDQDKKNIKLSFNRPGTYVITKSMSYACIAKEVNITIVVPDFTRVIHDSICSLKNEYYEFFGDRKTKEGVYMHRFNSGNKCDSIILLYLKDLRTSRIDTIDSTIECGKEFEFNGKKYSQSGQYLDSTIKECTNIIYIINLKFKYSIGNRIAQQFVACKGDKVQYNNKEFKTDSSFTLITSKDLCTKDTIDLCFEFLNCNCFQYPNIITPGDPNNNNRFRPVEIDTTCSSTYENIDFKIFNRWGKLIYESSDPEFPGWDGTKNGEPVPADTYVYTLTYDIKLLPKNCLESNTITKKFSTKGMFTLLR